MSATHFFAPKDKVRQMGVTLIEMMVAITIGMVLLGAMLSLFSGLSGTNRTTEAQAQMNEDAQYALRLLSNQLRQASYNPIQPGRATLNPLPFGVFACDTGFINATGTTAPSASFLNCNAPGSSTGGALVVSYEADAYNTTPLTTNATIPTDCLGNGLTLRTAEPEVGSVAYYVAENRFYIANSTLYCAGNGGGVAAFTPQPMVENVEALTFSYGTSDPAVGSAGRSVTGYLTSDDIGPSNGLTAPADAQLAVLATPDLRWNKVVAVRVCITMRSAKPILDQPQHYFACNPDVNDIPIQANDNYLRKNYTMTVALRNRIAVP